MRDPEKDALEMAQRRETLLRTGFRLFAEGGDEGYSGARK